MATRTVKPADADIETYDEFMEGYPEVQREIPQPRTDIHDPIVPSNILDNAMSVTLVNLRYPNETVFVPQSHATTNGVVHNQFSAQHYLQFTDGVMVCSEEQAAVVMAQCPYVKREPNEGEVAVHPHSGFATRSMAIYQEHADRYAEDFMG